MAQNINMILNQKNMEIIEREIIKLTAGKSLVSLVYQ